MPVGLFECKQFVIGVIFFLVLGIILCVRIRKGLYVTVFTASFRDNSRIFVVFDPKCKIWMK